MARLVSRNPMLFRRMMSAQTRNAVFNLWPDAALHNAGHMHGASQRFPEQRSTEATEAMRHVAKATAGKELLTKLRLCCPLIAGLDCPVLAPPDAPNTLPGV